MTKPDPFALKVISKANRLQSGGKYLYCNAQILSDIRPVFNEDPNEQPVGAVITHTLKIVQHVGTSTRMEESYIVLDSQDLEDLKDIVMRASAKDKTLRALLKSTNLPNLGA